MQLSSDTCFESKCFFFRSHDRTMHDIVYKLVPNLQESELSAFLRSFKFFVSASFNALINLVCYSTINFSQK